MTLSSAKIGLSSALDIAIVLLFLFSSQNHPPTKDNQAVPLEIASAKGYKQIIERLLEAGANKNYQTKVKEYIGLRYVQ